MAENYEIIGLTEIEEALNDLPIKMQAQIYRALNRKAVKRYVIDNIRSTVNYSSETEKGITIKNDRNDKTAVVGGVSSDVFWLRFADRGTAARYTEKGAYRGQITAKDQIQPEIFASVDDIIEYMRVEIGNEMASVIEKRIKSTQKKIDKI